MNLFGAIDIANTGADAMQTWIDANSSNIANIDDAVSPGTTPYEEQVAEFTPVGATTMSKSGSGVATAVDLTPDKGEVAHDPGNPLADKSGNVVYPDISLGDQLVGLLQAQEGYEANTSVIQKAQSAYQAGLSIGS